MKTVETEYKCETCGRSVVIFTDVTHVTTDEEAKAYAAKDSLKSPVLASFAQKHSQHQLRQYTELEPCG
jgi:DNA-directed RNA polymerase subunit RPC12/RpoP